MQSSPALLTSFVLAASLCPGKAFFSPPCLATCDLWGARSSCSANGARLALAGFPWKSSTQDDSRRLLSKMCEDTKPRDRQVVFRRDETDEFVIKRVFDEIKATDIGRIEVKQLHKAIDSFFSYMKWSQEDAQKQREIFDSIDGTLTFREFVEALEEGCLSFELAAQEYAVILEDMVEYEDPAYGADVYEMLLQAHYSPFYKWIPKLVEE